MANVINVGGHHWRRISRLTYNQPSLKLRAVFRYVINGKPINHYFEEWLGYI